MFYAIQILLFLACTAGVFYGVHKKRPLKWIIACAFFSGYNLAFIIAKAVQS